MSPQTGLFNMSLMERRINKVKAEEKWMMTHPLTHTYSHATFLLMRHCWKVLIDLSFFSIVFKKLKKNTQRNFSKNSMFWKIMGVSVSSDIRPP